MSYKGRLFAVAWIYFDLVIVTVPLAMLTTALTTVALKSATKINGSKVSVQGNQRCVQDERWRSLTGNLNVKLWGMEGEGK